MNTNNPFAPPTADLTLPPEPDALIKKPRSVWVMQIISGIFAAWCTFGLVKLGMLVLAGERESRFGVSLLLQLPLQTGFVALVLLMLWQLPKRSRTGRNIGLGFIALPIITLAMRLLETKAQAWPEMLGVAIVAFIVMAPLFYWAYAFAFSEKARRYFQEPERG